MSKLFFSLLFILCLATSSSAQRSPNRTSQWQTLSGNAPLVIARGGYSGIFPDSSNNAYQFALATSLPNVVLWCDVQLTKDGAGICSPNLWLNNGSDIQVVFASRRATYPVNGIPVQGWFSVDFTLNDLSNVNLVQAIYSRTEKFDRSLSPILTVQEVAQQIRPPGLWLNIQHDAFFSQHNLSMRSFVISASRSVVVNYISSPEVNFLRSIVARFNPRTTKLVFRFLGQEDVEPSTNQTYGSLLQNLTFIKTFASGILVPKYYIWPVDRLYLRPHTSVVLDAHREGLEVFASTFVNDAVSAYDYNYDPVAEYLNFIDNGNFSVDGVLSDFPLTPSATIDCFSHLGRNKSEQAKPLIISSEGASGKYTGCTNLAYTQAILDGADVLDCPIQLTKDGIPFCMGSINLIDRTTVAQANFSSLTKTIPELHTVNGIFTFDLTWSQIQGLRPAIQNPWRQYNLLRNPKSQNDGSFMTLAEFLAFANNETSISGVLISIENVAYLAKQGLSVIDVVFDALSEAGYNNQTVNRVMIQSTNSSVLMKFKEKSNYELLYRVDENIRDVLNSTILGIKRFANFVVIDKESVLPSDDLFLTGEVTDVVQKLQAFNLLVYVRLFSNEFVSQAWDFLSDPYVEINTFCMSVGIDGVITDFPGTAAKYRGNRCLGLGDNTPIYMSPVQPGFLLPVIPTPSLPPALPPNPVLTDSDVVEPPLPPVGAIAPAPDNSNRSTPATPPPPPSGQPKTVASICLSTLVIILSTLSLF